MPDPQDRPWTKGPWRVADHKVLGPSIEGPNGEDLAYANLNDGYDEPTDYPALANARLIAAAPDLFEALEFVRAHCARQSSGRALMTQDTRHYAVVDDRQSPPRDLADVAGDASCIAVSVEHAGRWLGLAFEDGSTEKIRPALAELSRANLQLAALIFEIEQHFAEPMGGEGQ
jgi:hypothetical protein